MSVHMTYPPEAEILHSPEGDVIVWFEIVGPERARQLLKTYRVDYRKERPTHRSTLARDMKNGFWNFDGSPIRIDENGNLIDGQHRLSAVEESGIPQLFLFVGNLPEKAYDTIDQGLARTYADLLRKRGYANVSQRTAVTKLIARWEEGRSLDETRRFTNSELDVYHDKYGDSITRAVASTLGSAKRVCLPPALTAFTWWLLSTVDKEDAYTFMVGFLEGENLTRGMPAFTLRDRLYRDRDYQYSRMEYMYLILQAWRAFRANIQIHRLNLPKGEVTREKLVLDYETPQT